MRFEELNTSGSLSSIAGSFSLSGALLSEHHHNFDQSTKRLDTSRSKQCEDLISSARSGNETQQKLSHGNYFVDEMLGAG
jgi:hypothetical protein